jgi:hypothetical protein
MMEYDIDIIWDNNIRYGVDLRGNINVGSGGYSI